MFCSPTVKEESFVPLSYLRREIKLEVHMIIIGSELAKFHTRTTVLQFDQN